MVDTLSIFFSKQKKKINSEEEGRAGFELEKFNCFQKSKQRPWWLEDDKPRDLHGVQ
jgi:hypothetical protein